MNNLDQHFLKDAKIVKAMVKAGEISSSDTVLEIGPGKGILTKEIALKAGKVIAIEIDEGLVEYLDQMPENVQIIYANALDRMDALEYNKIIASIPYSITEPLFKRIIKRIPELTVLLIGKDFFELLSGNKNYTEEKSKWAVIGKIFLDIKKIKDVPPTTFEPEPKTDSVIVKLTKRKKELNAKEKVIRELILQDDKKTKNAIIYALVKAGEMTKKQAKEKVKKMGLNETLLERNSDRLSSEQFSAVIEQI